MQDYYKEIHKTQLFTLENIHLENIRVLFSFKSLVGLLITFPAVIFFQLLSIKGIYVPPLTGFFSILIVMALFGGGYLSGLLSLILAVFYSFYFLSLPGKPFLYSSNGLYLALLNGFTLIVVYLLACWMYHHVCLLFSKVRESERKYRAFFMDADTPAFILSLGADGLPGERIEANNAALAGLGYNAQEFKAKSLIDLNNELNNCDLIQELSLLRTKGSGKLETVYINKTGENIPIEINILYSRNSREELIIGTVHDLRDQKRAEYLEHTIDEKKRLLEETMRNEHLRTEFFSNLSHELRTPINVIFSTLHLFSLFLEEDVMEETRKNAKKYVHIMKQNCYRLLRLINNIIDITKIDSGFSELKLINLDVVNLVENITLSVAEYVENKELTLIFDTDTEEKIIACDPDKIERIMLNLLSNAVKFTPKGGTIEVKLLGESCPDKIQIIVSDTGIGVPSDKMNTLFKRFGQINYSLENSHQGSGIGLSLVKSFVELHKGSIHLESQTGVGSTFIIELPSLVLDEEPDQMMQESPTNRYIERINVEFSDIYS